MCEIVDARIPVSSRNPDIDELTAGKPRLVVLNRADQADPEATKRWAAWFRAEGFAVLECDAKSGAGTKQFAAAVRTLLADKLRAYAEKGQNRVVRVMILGVPNVGKSTFINRIAGRKTAKTEDRPGVTRAKQWVPIDRGLELLDTPGILWPKFEDQSVGLNLAYTGAVKDEILDVETLGCHLMAYLGANYPEALKTGYKLPALPEREDGGNGRGLGLPPAGGRREKAGLPHLRRRGGHGADGQDPAGRVSLRQAGTLYTGAAGEEQNSLRRQSKGGAPMNCPVCGKEMEPGFRNTYGKWDYFWPRGASELTLHTTKRIEERGGIVLDDPYTRGKDSGALDRPAWVCRTCRKIVIQYW